MLKLAGKIIDSYDDPRFAGWSGLGGKDLPDASDVQALPDRDFAIIIKTAAGRSRKYPIATPALTKISAAYFKEHGHQLPAPMQDSAAFYIKEAAARHDVEVGVASNASGVVPRVYTIKESASNDMRVDLDKTAAAHRAEEELLAHYGRMTPLERALAANDLAKVASINDSRVYDYVIKSSIGPNIKDGIRQRMSLLQDDAVKTASLKHLLVRMRDVDAGRAAVMLHQFDKLAGYGDRVTDAFITCWGGVAKTADAKADLLSYKLTTLAVAHGEQVHRVFSDDIADAFIRDPINYYERRAKGQVKTMLRYLANQVGTQTPKSEVNRGEVKDAVKSIRSDEHTPWSKTLAEIRSV